MSKIDKSPEEKADAQVINLEQIINQDKLSERSNNKSNSNGAELKNSAKKISMFNDNLDVESNDPSAKSMISYAPGMKKKSKPRKTKLLDANLNLSRAESFIDEEDKKSDNRSSKKTPMHKKTKMGNIPPSKFDSEKINVKNIIEEEDEDIEKQKEDESIKEIKIHKEKFENMDTQTFFNNIKAKKKHNEKFYSDDSNLKRLREIKLERRPIDFENLKKHEQTFLAESYQKKEKRTQEMKDQLNKLQSSYEIEFKSKRYKDHKKSYMGDRNYELKQKEKYAKTINIKNKYAKNAYEISSSERASQDQEVRERFPMIGKDHMRWYYGRFGKKEYFDSVNTTKSKNIHKIRHERGQEYMDICKELKMPRDQVLLKEQKRTEDQLESDRLGDRRLRAKSNDYLTSIRESRPKDFYNKVSHNNSVNIEKRLDIKAYMKQSVFLKNPIKKTEINNDKINTDKVSDFIEIFNEFDDKARSRERKICNHIKRNKACMEKQPTLLSQKARPEDIDNYYLAAIKAKLSFLDEIKN